DGTKKSTSTITVTEPVVAVTGVTVSPKTTSIAVGATKQLKETVSPTNATDKSVTWKSSDETIAKVDKNGLVTAVAEGTATVTVTTTDGSKTSVCDVTVTAASGA